MSDGHSGAHTAFDVMLADYVNMTRSLVVEFVFNDGARFRWGQPLDSLESGAFRAIPQSLTTSATRTIFHSH